VSNLVLCLNEILTNVKTNSNLDDVAKKPGKYLGQAIKIYADFLRNNGLVSFEEFMQKVTYEGKTNEPLRDAVDELWKLEEMWDDFLHSIIGKSQVANERLSVLEELDSLAHHDIMDTQLIDARNGQNWIFSEMIKSHSLKTFFPDYEGIDYIHFVLLRHFA